ncbi:hypothetical protein LO763_05855 [Glycomyces sp. A-F 0318]|uniref:hypothetical protein n=1 Tax=Glycomyces amatae TaxID=2881355 RepID=UPI001E362C52|nr:hypothetical protein [Glycomyces amatae]MCD0443153.1 hypothetical protein [Glycomyces amatae]
MSEDPRLRRNRLQNRWTERAQRERDQRQDDTAATAGGGIGGEATAPLRRPGEANRRRPEE